MKGMLCLLLFSFAVKAQTIHYDDDEIRYKGRLALKGVSATAVASRLPGAAETALQKSKSQGEILRSDTQLVVRGAMALNAPYAIKKVLHYTVQLQPQEEGCRYHIDSVSVSEQRRGWKPKLLPAKELLEGIEDTGTVAIETERLLNEIDLRFQKLLALLQSALKSE